MEWLGYLGAAFAVILSAGASDMRWFRPGSAIANMAFIAYALHAEAGLILMTHAMLLPINLLHAWRAWHPRGAGRRGAGGGAVAASLPQSTEAAAYRPSVA